MLLTVEATCQGCWTSKPANQKNAIVSLAPASWLLLFLSLNQRIANHGPGKWLAALWVNRNFGGFCDTTAGFEYAGYERTKIERFYFEDARREQGQKQKIG